MTKRCAVYCGCGPILIISYNIVPDDTAVRRDREQKNKKKNRHDRGDEEDRGQSNYTHT